MRLANRLLTIAVGGVFVTAVWSILARTGWGRTRQYLGAGLGFDGWFEPLATLLGLLVVAVLGTRLIERAWRSLFPETVRPVRPRPARAAQAPASTPRAA